MSGLRTLELPAPPDDSPRPPEQSPAAKPVTAAPRLRLWRRLLAQVGIITDPARRWHVALQPRLFVILLASFGLFLLSFGGLFVYSTDPEFCNSCHIMEPYYEAWKKSSHKDVSCVDCHYAPGGANDLLWQKFQASTQLVKYVTRTYGTKPNAEIQDASCLRSGCHETRLLNGSVVSKLGIRFDHEPHLEEQRKGPQLRCVSCHSQMAVDNHMEVTWDTCYLCHLKNENNDAKISHDIELMTPCQSCHILPDKKFEVDGAIVDHKQLAQNNDLHCRNCHQDAIHGNAQVGKSRCKACHNKPEHLERFADVGFIHENHVTKHHVACMHCHEEISHGVTEAGHKDLKYDCAVCHSEAHDIKRNLYRGVGARGVPPMPSSMYLANVDCTGCHKDLSPAQADMGLTSTYEADEKSCKNCHGDLYRDILVNAQAEIDDLVGKLNTDLATVRAALKNQPKGRTPPAKLVDALKDAEHNLKFIGMARGSHNIYYSIQTLRATRARVRAAARWARTKIQDTSKSVLVTNDSCTKLCHSKVGVNILEKKILFQGRDLKHKEHVEMGLACTKCHTFGAHKEVNLKSKKTCKHCHKDADIFSKQPAPKNNQ